MRGTRPVVTLWETYGSGMAEVGSQVAAAMDLEVSPQAFSSDELQAALDQEDTGSVLAWVHALIRSDAIPAARGDIPGVERSRDDLVAENTAAVLAAAVRGGVLMGRNATVILRGRPNTLHVKLDGPEADRITYASERFRLTREQAALRLRREDDARCRISIALYDWDPGKNDHYDLVLNTALLGPGTSARIIVAAAAMKFANQR